MAQEYAIRQPQGFKNHIEKVAIVGAGGQVGKFMVTELLKTGKHKVTAITRTGSTAEVPPGVEVKRVDYDDQSSLVEALRGQEALIITMAVTAPPGQASKLFEAAAAANVPWVLPNEWGLDSLNVELGKDALIGATKIKERDMIEQLGKSSWISIICSFWYEYSLSFHSVAYGFDIPNRAVTFYDDGKTRINTSTWSQVGRAVASLLSFKVLPHDENDKGPCLAHYRNMPVYISSFNVSQSDMLDSIMRVTGTSSADWKIDHESVQERYKAGLEEFKAGSRMGFGKLLYARVFYPDMSGNFETTKGLQNEILGLPEENLDEATKVAVKMAESSPTYGR